MGLDIYDVSTGKRLAAAVTGTRMLNPLLASNVFGVTDIIEDKNSGALVPWFTPNGHTIRGIPRKETSVGGWQVIEGVESGTTRLQALEETVPPGTPSWVSSHGYEITDDWWVLSPTQKRLLWLPHRWRSGGGDWTWSGRFLGLAHRELTEAVVLEFFE